MQSYNLQISQRTFQRDLDDIRSLYNIDILYDHSQLNYYIDSEDTPELQERILEAFDTLNALNITDRLSNHIHFEKRKPQGTENLYGLLHAIKLKFQITFTYQKYQDDVATIRKCEPYALKEFRNRWYILAKDLNDKKVKSFSLDRLSNLDITQRHFQYPEDFNVNEHYRYSFGIISPNSDAPQEILLLFTPLQGKYIKSLPLHTSQEILKDTDKELLIKLTLYITHDFIMELLSFGDNVEIIAPDDLINIMSTIYQNASNKYSNRNNASK